MGKKKDKDQTLFLSEFYVKQVPPVVKTETLENGVIKLRVGDRATNTLLPTGTKTNDYTETATVMELKLDTFPDEVRGRLPEKKVSDEDIDGPTSDNDSDEQKDKDEVRDNGEEEIDYDDFVQIRAPFGDANTIAVIKLNKKTEAKDESAD